MPNPIVLSRFGGCFPELAPHNLPDGAASDALNCDLRWGKITALPSTLPDATTVGGEVAPGDLFLLRKAKMPVRAGWSPVIATPIKLGLTDGWIELKAELWIRSATYVAGESFNTPSIVISNSTRSCNSYFSSNYPSIGNKITSCSFNIIICSRISPS